jgi:hypothetical protein
MSVVTDDTSEWKGQGAIERFDALIHAVDSTVVLGNSKFERDERMEYLRRATFGMSLRTREQVDEQVHRAAHQYVERKRALYFYSKRHADFVRNPTKNLLTSLPQRSRDGKKNEMPLSQNANLMNKFLESRNNVT